MNRTFRYATRILLLLYFPAAAFAQHEPQTNSTLLQQGLNLFEKGLYSEASAKFQLSLKEHSGDVQDEELAAYFYTRAQSRLDSSRTDQLTDRYVQDYPKSRYSSLLLKEVADQHRERGELDQAIDRMQEALKYPQSSNKKAELYYIIAETAAENNQNDLARSTFLELSDNFRSSDWSPKALYARGRLYLEDEQYQNASSAFELLQERHPFDPVTRRIGTALGESYYQQRRYTEA
ncbi:MAG TPA: tetratricopeptide repeat protein, partial [Balneolaceae bacterium]|nr:tetratricopeptide repeat protein [Balneolaceae bacterium]